METILEYYIINPITNIDYKTHSITIKHDVDYLMININRISPEPELVESKSIPRITNIKNIAHQKYLQNYIEKFKKILKLPSSLKYGINYFIVPLAILPSKIILGIILFASLQDSIMKYSVLQSWDILTPISNDKNSKGFDILAGVLNGIMNSMSTLQKYYFINCHNYLPKFKIIKMEQKIKAQDSFRKLKMKT
jgi:hypothetical protein